MSRVTYYIAIGEQRRPTQTLDGGWPGQNL